MRIATVVFPGVTAIDFIGPLNAWMMLPDFELQVVAGAVGPVPTDCGMDVLATHDFDTCWQDPDVLLMPGAGRGLFEFLQDDASLDGIARLGGNAKWVTSVCTGSLALGAAGLLKGYRAACYWYARDALAHFGATPDEGRVVIDRNRASGGGMTSGIDFAIHMAGEWFGPDAGRLIELSLEYAPQPPFGVGRPELADPATLATARAILETQMPLAMALQAARRRGFAD